ncbi:hypothetical protein LPB072_10310 [Hydrogenophaga crassostreae]|uniref:SPOR domain-containing protein n=3 Tax=Hydrogenophaga crassostreae TaxID=1763535 RepID=A0A1D8NVQ7_9BURK|nr:hypothetical protein LPB072_10310 [Hydrogenophaga crassostreae]
MGLATMATAGLIALFGALSPPAQAATKDAVIEAVQLPAWVERNGQRRAARPGDKLLVNDTAVTAESSRMLLRLPDRSVIKLGEKTEFRIETLAAKQQGFAGPSHTQSALRLITGVFRYATDYTSKALGNTRDISLQMTTATVGIRGTDFWSMTDADHDAVCLFEGSVAVERDSREDILLDKPGAFWVIRTNQPEQAAGQASPDALQKFIAQAELKPGSGVLLQGGRWRTVAALLPSGSAAADLRTRLQTAGYPAEILGKQGHYEVRINDLATELDAQAVLERLKADASLGVTSGRVALAAQ